ncbi:MAG: SIS domain-containing protein [Thermoplasmata archaeon]|nr:SIS domain-containing protein [Thermoplasmata archaeon]
MSDLDCLDGILDNCRRAVGSVDPAAREALIQGILGRRKVFIYGSGRSGLVGQMFAVRLVQLGLDVHFVGEMTTPIIGKEDLTLLISYTGKTSSVVQTAQIARRIGSEIICVTGVQKCPLVNASDVAIVMEVPDGADVRRTAPLGTVFEDSALLLFDCIVSEIMAREGVTEEEMRNRHAIWVRSLGLDRGGQPVAVIVDHVHGQLAGRLVHHDQHARSALVADRRDHLVGRLGALGGEEHADLGLPASLDYPEDALAVRVHLPGEAALRGPPGGVENRRERVRSEYHVDTRAQPASHR